jgi:Na+-translocating ferredoxin:NAD+ oxidoreductase RnfD subunit
MTQSVATPRPVLVSSVPRGGIGVGGFYSTFFMGALFPLTAGIILYGWHAIVATLAVLASTAVAVAFWRRIGARGRMIHYAHAMWLALLLALMLPAHLAADPGSETGMAVWPILPVAALILVMLLWLLGGLGGGHLHPVLATYLLLVVGFGPALVPHRVLNRAHLVTGELFHTGPLDAPDLHTGPWISRRDGAADADYLEPSAEQLTRYTSGRQAIGTRKWMDLQGLLRDVMPPLEDFIVAGQPGPIGVSSVVAIIIGGLFLLYRGVIDYRIPLLTCAAAYVALLILPIPALIDNGPQWRWAAFRTTANGWSVGLTFADYEVMASPLIFVAFFLATSATVRPMTRRARTIYAVLLGIAIAASQLYLSVSFGPYLALLVVSLLTPQLDRWFRAKPLV